MDTQSNQPAENPQGYSEPSPRPGAGGTRALLALVALLYGLSLAAALAILLRSRPSAKSEAGGAAALLAFSGKDAVGWIPVHGPIFTSASGRLWEGGAEQLAKRIRSMAKSKSVKAIVLDINSPGGSVGAVQEVYSQILRVRRESKIPFVALFDDVAASGGYYIAAACDKIVAHPGSLTGSIGVIFDVSNLTGLFGKIGYKMTAIKSGRFKDIGSPARAMTPDERRLLQRLINDAYGQFLGAVSTGRHMPLSRLRPLADGRIFSGDQALKNGLVDELGDSQDAIDLAAKLGRIKGKPRVLREPEALTEIMELLSSRWGGSLGLAEAARSALGADRGSAPHLDYLWTGPAGF